MTIDGPAAGPAPCPTCGSVSEVGDRFCDRCGNALTVDNAAPRGPVGDAATRRMCAGAHLDDAFCRAVIAEHLVEPTRQIPASPGVDASAVLRDAVAARRRRQIRDQLLVVLFLVGAVTSPFTALLWAAVAYPASVMVRSRRGTVQRTAAIGCLFVLLVGVLPFLALLFVGAVYLVGEFARSAGGFWARSLPSLSDLAVLGVGGVSTVAGVLLLVVLLADELARERLMRFAFRPGAFRAAAEELPSGLDRSLRLLGVARFRAGLDRVSATERERAPVGDGAAEVIVYRGDHPFVGTGDVDADEVFALPLTPRTPGEAPEPFEIEALHAAVTDAVRELRRAGTLAPSERLTTLTDADVVIVPAERLLTDPVRQPHPPVLAGPDVAPRSTYPVEAARALAVAPQEWARYYRCFRVEAWDRDLAVSAWFSAGRDDRMLYFELVCTVLRPLDQRFDRVDRAPAPPAVVRALARWALLPVSLPVRLRSAVHRFRPVRQQTGTIVPERYGADRGLRELAAGRGDDDYFQRGDIVRYEQILRTTVLHAVIDFLSARGYSVADLSGRAPAAGSPITFVDNRFAGVAVAGGTFHGPTAFGRKIDQRITDTGKNQGETP